MCKAVHEEVYNYTKIIATARECDIEAASSQVLMPSFSQGTEKIRRTEDKIWDFNDFAETPTGANVSNKPTIDDIVAL